MEEHGMDARAQEAGFDRGFVAEHGADFQLDVIGHLGVPAAQLLGYDLGEAGVVHERVGFSADVHASAKMIGTHGRIVDRADDGEMVRLPRDLGQQLANVDAGHARWDGTKRAAGGGTWLGVPGLKLAGTAAEVDDDYRLAL